MENREMDRIGRILHCSNVKCSNAPKFLLRKNLVEAGGIELSLQVIDNIE
jgi:hypothetical protein